MHIITLALGAALVAAGVTFTALSVAPRAEWVDIIGRYGDVAYSLDSSYETNINLNGHAVTLSGPLTYDEGGSEDPVFGVKSETVFIVRISEMYQYRQTDGGVWETVWSEEIIPGGEGLSRNTYRNTI